MTVPAEHVHHYNPMQTDGFEFVEYSSPDPGMLRDLFLRLGFPVTARHRSRDVTLHRQGDITFIVNGEPASHARRFAAEHGPSVSAMAFRVGNAANAFDRAVDLGAVAARGTDGTFELDVPAIEGVGGSRLYLIDQRTAKALYEREFVPEQLAGATRRPDLLLIDHLTHNVRRGNLQKWVGFYETLFGFREIRYFDIEGMKTGLTSRALTSPCGKIRIPINESKDDCSQIEEFIAEYHGEGIQHIALASADIYRSIDQMRARGVMFQDTPDAYYEGIDARVADHGEPVVELKSRRILIDGSRDAGILLQIFTTTLIGPVFIEIIQRKGNDGFGEGNFRALFESIELDQMRRGVL